MPNIVLIIFLILPHFQWGSTPLLGQVTSSSIEVFLPGCPAEAESTNGLVSVRFVYPLSGTLNENLTWGYKDQSGTCHWYAIYSSRTTLTVVITSAFIAWGGSNHYVNELPRTFRFGAYHYLPWIGR